MPKILIDEFSVGTPVREPQLAEQLVGVPTIISFSSLQRTVEQNVDIAVPRRGVRRLQGRIQWRFPSSKSFAFLFLMVKVFKLSSQDKVLRHFLNFHKKSATRPRRSGSALPPHLSPWTPPAYAVSMGREDEMAKRRQERQQQTSETLEKARLLLDQASKRRKRKKRRKRRLPKSLSHSSHRRARRHPQCLWLVLLGFSSSRSVLLCC